MIFSAKGTFVIVLIIQIPHLLKVNILFYVEILKAELSLMIFFSSKFIESNHLKVKSFYVMVWKG